MSQEYSLPSLYTRLLRRWWVLVLLAALGGMGGLVFSLFTPAVYEAQAFFSAEINAGRITTLERMEEDMLIGYSMQVINSTPVRQATIQKANTAGLEIDENTFLKDGTLERQYFRLVLRVRHANPEIAARLANLWAETAAERYLEVYAHAQKAEELRLLREALAACLERGEITACGYSSAEELKTAMATTTAEFLVEQQASAGIDLEVDIHLTQLAVVLNQPVQFQRGMLALAGATIGFVLALMIIAAGILERFYARQAAP